MSKYKKRLGKVGEDYAVEYLKGKGYEVIGRNVYIGGGEIDIICKRTDLIVFVEVKTRKSDMYVDILDSMDEAKEEALTTSCEEYLASKNFGKYNYRIDLIGIVINNSEVKKFQHIEGII
ncbi:YraN family protein [Candidatus Dojkabacteria bacterium]|nr:YraN family protein [Candidatus Dojkabacteria bacterium]